jgi:hypothetical protein
VEKRAIAESSAALIRHEEKIIKGLAPSREAAKKSQEAIFAKKQAVIRKKEDAIAKKKAAIGKKEDAIAKKKAAVAKKKAAEDLTKRKAELAMSKKKRAIKLAALKKAKAEAKIADAKKEAEKLAAKKARKLKRDAMEQEAKLAAEATLQNEYKNLTQKQIEYNETLRAKLLKVEQPDITNLESARLRVVVSRLEVEKKKYDAIENKEAKEINDLFPEKFVRNLTEDQYKVMLPKIKNLLEKYEKDRSTKTANLAKNYVKLVETKTRLEVAQSVNNDKMIQNLTMRRYEITKNIAEETLMIQRGDMHAILVNHKWLAVRYYNKTTWYANAKKQLAHAQKALPVLQKTRDSDAKRYYELGTMANPPRDASKQGQVLEAAIVKADKLKEKYNNYTIPNAEKEIKAHSQGLAYIKKQMDMVKTMIKPQGLAVKYQESARDKF